jgi:hypothetical protein
VNAAIFWLDVVLLGLLAGNTLGAEAKEPPGRNAVSTPFPLNDAELQMADGASIDFPAKPP